MDVSALSSTSADTISATIKQTAQASGADFDYLLNQAKLESSLNANAKSSQSSAMGLYQFTSGTWLNLIKQYGSNFGLGSAAQSLAQGQATSQDKANLLNLRKDPTLSTQMAAQFAVQNAQSLAAAGFTQLGPQDLYLAHFLGSNGASKFLKNLQSNPNAAAANVLPAAAQANPAIFYANGQPTSFQQIYTRFQSKFASSNVPTQTQYAAASQALAAIAQTPAAQALATDLSQALRPVESMSASAPQSNAVLQLPLTAQNSSDGSSPVSPDVLAHYLNNFDTQSGHPRLDVIAPSQSAEAFTPKLNGGLDAMPLASANALANISALNALTSTNLMTTTADANITSSFATGPLDNNAFITPFAQPKVGTDGQSNPLQNLASDANYQTDIINNDLNERASHLSSILYTPPATSAKNTGSNQNDDSANTSLISKTNTEVTADPVIKSRQWTGLWSLAPQKS
jgi:hypothetical protein